MSDWQWTTRNYVARLPVLAFPFEAPPRVYVPQSTVLRLPDGRQLSPYHWCYLERKLRKPFTELNLASLSAMRVEAMHKVIDYLSKWVRFEGMRPGTVVSQFVYLSLFLSWVDGPEHQARFEAIFTNTELALDALKDYHTYLRQACQAGELGGDYAATRDQAAIRIMSELHDRVFLDEIEPLSHQHSGEGVRAPHEAQVGGWMSTLQAIFDSVDRLTRKEIGERSRNGAAQRIIQISATDDAKTVVLPDTYSQGRLLELGCVVFAGLVIGDSGANLAQIRQYEEPEDLRAQLAVPERITLTQKVIKFRAGGIPVPVHLTATTLTRLPAYLRMRQDLIVLLGGRDIAEMFVQCQFEGWKGLRRTSEPVAIKTLSKTFLHILISRTKAVGAVLPPITFQQLRSHKQQHILRKHGVKVAADTMGHSIATAVKAYSKVQEDVRRSDIGQFLSSLSSTVIEVSGNRQEQVDTVGTAVAACKDYGKPSARETDPPVTPDCRKTEGCFFCEQFRLHADAQDVRKLVSCRHVLQRLAPLQGGASIADRVYEAVLDHIDALLAEIERRVPQIYEEMREDVDQKGNLTPYWAMKLQQLHLLGVLVPVA